MRRTGKTEKYSENSSTDKRARKQYETEARAY